MNIYDIFIFCYVIYYSSVVIYMLLKINTHLNKDLFLINIYRIIRQQYSVEVNLQLGNCYRI